MDFIFDVVHHKEILLLYCVVAARDHRVHDNQHVLRLRTHLGFERLYLKLSSHWHREHIFHADAVLEVSSPFGKDEHGAILLQ